MEARARRTNLVETAVLKEIANLGGNIFEHDCERLPGITSGSKSFPADENFETISGFSDVLDLVNRVPDAIGKLRDFLPSAPWFQPKRRRTA